MLALQYGDMNAQEASVKVDFMEKDDTLVFSFYNPTQDTLQLFSTYFAKTYLLADMLHKVDTKNNIYKVSFLPILPYLTGYLDDRLVLTDENKISMVGQNLYSFIKILPNSRIDVELPCEVLFSKKDNKNNVVRDFNNEFINVKDVKKITLGKQKGLHRLVFEFAIYKDVSLLLNREKYISGELKTYEQTKDYTIINVPIALKSNKLPIELE